jgi:hypothetical protein
MIELPKDIDYSIYNSTSGMSTKHWGPAAWNFLFTSIMGTYPFKIDLSIPEHIIIRHNFKQLLTSLRIIMPCIFCRNSFTDFLKELPIDDYLIGRIELMYWLYKMKDKVNNKLLKQEKECYYDEKKRLIALFNNNQISQKEYKDKLSEFKQNTFKTVPTIPFKNVLDKYEGLRATCSKKAKTCALPAKKN